MKLLAHVLASWAILLLVVFSSAHAQANTPVDGDDLSIYEGTDEEIVFNSPEDMEQAFKDSIPYLAAQAEEAGADLNVTEWCLKGYIWDCEKSEALKALAADIAKKRMVEREEEQGRAMAERVLPQIGREELLSLPPPSAMGSGERAPLTLVPTEVYVPGAVTDDDMPAGRKAVLDTVLSRNDSERAVSPVLAEAASMAWVESVSEGAIARSGALPENPAEWAEKDRQHRERATKLRYSGLFIGVHGGLDMENMLAMAARDRVNSSRTYNTSIDEEMHRWFEEGGGRLQFAHMARRGHAERGVPSSLVADEDVVDSDVILDVPLKLTMSRMTLRLIKLRRGRLTDRFGETFERKSEWGLAAFLLHEQGRGNESRWYPFIRTLRMSALKQNIIDELTGSYVSRLHQAWEEEVDAMLAHMRGGKAGCGHDFDGVCKAIKSRRNARWALWVVRQHAVTLQKITTGKKFLALVPYANLIAHRPGAGGAATLHLDNHIRLSVSEHGMGEQLYMDRGNFSDAESLLRFREVPEENPHNAIQLRMPGCKTELSDMHWFLDHLNEWRRMLKYPPKQGDMWRAARDLLLYGDDWDEEENKAMEAANKLIAGEQVTVGSHEEHLLLIGAATSLDEAKALVAGTDPSAIPEPQLYVAVEPDPTNEHDEATRAQETLANAALEAQEAFAAGHTEPSVLKALNKTRAFFERGVRPIIGMDPIDKLLKRKKLLLDKCGSPADFVLDAHGVSEALLCAVRTHIVHEIDLDIVCPAGKAPFNDHECVCEEKNDEGKCADGAELFNATRPISAENEARALAALGATLTSFRDEYKTTVEQDKLALSRLVRGPGTVALHGAIIARMREKLMLDAALADLDARKAALNFTDYQVDDLTQDARADAAFMEEASEWVEQARAAIAARLATPVASLNVTLDTPEGDSKVHTLAVYENQEMASRIWQFMHNHSIPQQSFDTLQTRLGSMARSMPPLLLAMPVLTPGGQRHILSVHEGENVTEVARAFCVEHNITNFHRSTGFCGTVMHNANATLARRMNRSLLLTVPVTVPDGRKTLLTIRRGEQHDIYTTVKKYAEAYAVAEDMILSLANEVHRRLPRQLTEINVNTPNGQIPFRVRAGDDIEEEAVEFCKMYDFDVSAAPSIRQQALARLNPDAMIAPAQ